MNNATSVKSEETINTQLHAISVLPQSVCDAAKLARSADVTADKRWLVFSELCKERNIIASYCVSPPKTKSKQTADKPFNRNSVVMLKGDDDKQIATNRGEVYDDIVNLAYSFLPKKQQVLLDTDTKHLDEDGKAEKRRASNDRGSIVSRMKAKLEEAETGEKKRKPGRQSTVKERIFESVELCLEWNGANEEPDYDVNEVARGLGIALKALKARQPNS